MIRIRKCLKQRKKGLGIRLSYVVHKNTPDPEVIKLFSWSTQLSMKFFLLINVKMPTIVGILTFICGKNNTLGLSESENAEFLYIYILMSN